MKTIAVVANPRKTLDGGLPELRQALARRGVVNPLWCEVSKSKHAPEQVRRALEHGADLVFAWGGDGMVQRCVDVLAGSKARLAIVPAGTANLLASNLGIPKKIDAAVEIGLNGSQRKVDVGHMHGERFIVMAGAGFDARVISDADGEMKRVLGRLAYVWAAARNFRGDPFQARIKIDGSEWYRGEASSVLLGNVGHLFGGITAFDRAEPDDGLLDVGVASADGLLQWGRTIVRTSLGDASKSPFVHLTQARDVEVTLDRKVLYQLDGGARRETKHFRVEVEPAAVRICVPPIPERTRHVA